MSIQAHMSLAPRTIAEVRTQRSQLLGRVLRVMARKASRRLHVIAEHIRLARQYQRELFMLMQGDERMLKDIGLTRAAIRSASEGVWWACPDRIVQSACMRRRRTEAKEAANARRNALPQVVSPSLAPAVPFGALETSNFR